MRFNVASLNTYFGTYYSYNNHYVTYVDTLLVYQIVQC